MPRRASDLRVEALEGRALLASRLFALPLGSPSVIAEIDPQSGAEIRRFDAPVVADPAGENGLAFDGRVIYYMPQDNTDRLWELDPDTGAVLRSTQVGDGRLPVDGIGVVGGMVYLQDHLNNQLIVVNPATETVVSRISVAADLIGGLTGADSPDELVATEGLTSAVRIDPATGTVLGRFGLPGPVFGAAFVDGKLYFGSAQTNQVYVTGRTGNLLETLSLPFPVSALAGDGVENEAEPETEQVVNGDFERGDLFGWSTYTKPGIIGLGFQAYSGADPFMRPLPAPPQGIFAAANNLGGPATQLLYQDVTLPAGQSAHLSLLIGYNNQAVGFVTPETLDSQTLPNQQFRIDVVDVNAGPLSTAAGDVLLTVFQTRVGDPNSLAPTEVEADLSAFAGRTVRLRIAVASNQFYLDTVVDAVSIKTGESPPTSTAAAYYVADLEDYGGGTGKVIRIDATTGTQTVVSSGGQFIDPYGVAQAPDGSLIVADQGLLGGTGTIFRVDPDTGAQTVITTNGYLVDPFEVVIAPDGSFLVADFGLGGWGRVIRVNPDTGEQTLVSDSGMLLRPFGIASAPDGLIYVASSGFVLETGQVFRIDPNTGVQTLIASGGDLVDPTDMVVAPDGSLIVSDANAFGGQGAIFRIDPTTGVQTLITRGGLFQEPMGLALTLDGRVVAADPFALDGIGALIGVDLMTGDQSIVASGGLLQHPLGVAVGSTATPPTPAPGSYYIADPQDYGGGTGAIIRVDPATGAQTVVSSGDQLINPYGVTVAPDGSLIVADHGDFGGTGTLFRVDPVTGDQTMITTGGYLVDPSGVVIAQDGSLLVADFDSGGAGRIVRVDPATGEQILLALGGWLQGSFGLATATDGSIYVASFGIPGGIGQIVRIDPATGAQTLIAIGGILSEPSGVVVAPDGSLIVADSNAFGGQGAILRVDPLTGGQTVISQGGLLVQPVAVSLTPDGRLLVADPVARDGNGALIAVDLATGAQSIVSSGGHFQNPLGIAVGSVPTPPIDTPPTASAGGPYTVEEGGTITLDASGTTDPDQDPASLTYLWDLNGNGIFGETGTPASSLNEVGLHPVFSAAGLPGGSTRTVSLVVIDASGQKSSATSTITIDNRPPNVMLGPDATVNAAALFTTHGSFTDPGAGEDFYASVDYGDGPGFQSLSLNPDRTFDLSHVYARAGTYTVVVYVTDGRGGTGRSSLVVTVNPLAPALDALTGASITYGQGAVTLGGRITGSAWIPHGSVVVTLAGVSQSAAIDPATGAFSTVFSVPMLGVQDSPYTVTYSYAGDGTYSSAIDATQVVTVAPRGLTIRAADASKVYGEPDPMFSVSFDGLVPGESPSVLGGALGFATNQPDGNAPVGSYTINPSGLSSPNYAIAYAPGTLTVFQATTAFSALGTPTVIVGTASTTFTGLVGSNSVLPVGQSVTVTIFGPDGPLASGTGAIGSDGRFSATIATASLPAGSFAVHYVYAGDENFAGIEGTGILAVSTNVSPLYDTTKEHHAGSAVPIKIAVADVSGNDLSSSSLVVSAVQLIDAQGVTSIPSAKGNSNPGGRFRKTGSAYHYNLDTSGLAPGKYTLLVTIGNDPVKHALTFVVG